MSTLRFDQLVADLAIRQQGKPYIWAGRGEWAVRGGQNVSVTELGCSTLAFDCAGLVTWACWRCGAADLRGWWSADHLWRFLPEMLPSETPDSERLVFFGKGNSATHVAIDIGRGRMVEAGGGGSKTLTWTDAVAQGANVRVRRIERPDLLGWRSLAACIGLGVRPPG